MNRLQRKIVCCLLIVPLTVLGNYLVLERILMPDSCDFHSHSNFLIDIFYTTSSATGFHPEPNVVNFIFTLCAGVFLALFTERILSKRLRLAH